MPRVGQEHMSSRTDNGNYWRMLSIANRKTTVRDAQRSDTARLGTGQTAQDKDYQWVDILELSVDKEGDVIVDVDWGTKWGKERYTWEKITHFPVWEEAFLDLVQQKIDDDYIFFNHHVLAMLRERGLTLRDDRSLIMSAELQDEMDAGIKMMEEAYAKEKKEQSERGKRAAATRKANAAKRAAAAARRPAGRKTYRRAKPVFDLSDDDDEEYCPQIARSRNH